MNAFHHTRELFVAFLRAPFMELFTFKVLLIIVHQERCLKITRQTFFALFVCNLAIFIIFPSSRTQPENRFSPFSMRKIRQSAINL